jgi:hypothetical protein
MNPRKLPLYVGCFLSGLFLLVGLIGTYAFGPKLLRWQGAASWLRVPGEIVSGEIISANAARGGRTVRPHFTWNYEAVGSARKGEGYGIARVTTSDLAAVEATLARYPVGARVELLVNPDDPDDSILERDPILHLVVLFVPPFFVLLGLIGAFFTLTGWLGWYQENTRNPFGRLVRAGFEVFLRPAVMKTFVVMAFALVCGGLVWWSVAKGNVIGVIVALIFAYGLRQAMRTNPRRRARR